MATGFLEPYDNAIDKIYDALVSAQTVGVDLSQIYMMLNNSCNSWGQYLCPVGTVEYSDDNSNEPPKVCSGRKNQCEQDCFLKYGETLNVNSPQTWDDLNSYKQCMQRCP